MEPEVQGSALPGTPWHLGLMRGPRLQGFPFQRREAPLGVLTKLLWPVLVPSLLWKLQELIFEAALRKPALWGVWNATTEGSRKRSRKGRATRCHPPWQAAPTFLLLRCGEHLPANEQKQLKRYVPAESAPQGGIPVG